MAPPPEMAAEERGDAHETAAFHALPSTAAAEERSDAHEAAAFHAPRSPSAAAERSDAHEAAAFHAPPSTTAAEEKGDAPEYPVIHAPPSTTGGADDEGLLDQRAAGPLLTDPALALGPQPKKAVAGAKVAKEMGEASSPAAGRRAPPSPRATPTRMRLKEMERDAVHARCLRIPMRPSWDDKMTKEELETQERQILFMWRKRLERLEKKENLVLTPFEKKISKWRNLWRVLERSDLLVQIVDARDPLSCRCTDLEVYLKEIDAHKRTLLLVNKAELLPFHIRKRWAAYFKAHDILYVFWSAKAATGKLGLKQLGGSSELGLDTKIFGRDDLLLKLQTEAKSIVEERRASFIPKAENANSSHSVSLVSNPAVVGLVGYPKVGISLTFQALTGMIFGFPFDATPILETELVLCACSSLVLPSFTNGATPLFWLTQHSEVFEAVEMTMHSEAIQVAEMTKLREAIQVVANDVPRNIFEEIYNISLPKPKPYEWQFRPPTSAELLHAYCASRTGVPDEITAAHVLLRDYINGRIPFCELPPGKTNNQMECEKDSDSCGLTTLEFNTVNETRVRTADQLKIDNLRARVCDEVTKENTKVGMELDNLQLLAEEIRSWFRNGRPCDVEVLISPFKLIGREAVRFDNRHDTRASMSKIEEMEYKKALVREKLKKMIQSLDSLKDKFESKSGLVRIINGQHVRAFDPGIMSRAAAGFQQITRALKTILSQMKQWNINSQLVAKICDLDDVVYILVEDLHCSLRKMPRLVAKCEELGYNPFSISTSFIDTMLNSAEDILYDTSLFTNDFATVDATGQNISAQEKFQQIVTKLKRQSRFQLVFNRLFKGHGNLITSHAFSSVEQPRCGYCFGRGATYFTTCCDEIFCSSCVGKGLYLVCYQMHVMGVNLHAPLLEERQIHK